jgi:chorismate dehydratase
MDKINVSVVSYLNSKPFIDGLQHSDISNQIQLSLDIPSVCAKKLINNEVDMGLVPVSSIPLLKEYYIVSDYCIGAHGKVASVMLYSDVPLIEIKTILLDYQSLTSVTLVKVLAKFFWKITPQYTATTIDFENLIKETTAGVIIGDRTFNINNTYKYAYDLSEEWQKYTGLPFVFACWVANKKLPENFISQFNEALQLGVNNISELANELTKNAEYSTDIKKYLTKNIQYNYDTDKKTALKIFLEYSRKLAD